MGIVKLPKMNKTEIEKLIEEENICRIAFIEDEYPYISPFQYVYIDKHFYFHFTDYGKKKKILQKNNKICISIDKFAADLSEYSFISMQGHLTLVDDKEEQKKVLKRMVDKAKQQFSPSFLSAHGFDKDSGWEGFELKDQVLYRFDQAGKTVALKSI